MSALVLVEVEAVVATPRTEDAEYDALVAKAQADAKVLAANLKKLQARTTRKGPQRRKFAKYWLSAEEEGEIVASRYGEDSWPARTVRFIQSDKLQNILLALLILDVVVVMTEILIDVEYPNCVRVVRDAISCMPGNDSSSSSSSSATADDGRRLSGELCASGTVESHAEAACDEHKRPEVHTAHSALLWTSVGILAVFLVELLTLAAALGRAFARNKAYLLDFVVVLVSLTLEVVLHHLGDQALAALVGLVIFARLWRFVRIVHGLATTTHEISHEEHCQHASQAEGLQASVEQLQRVLERQRAPPVAEASPGALGEHPQV